jgi:hypothetical protein
MTSVGRKRNPLGKYYRIIYQPTQVAIDKGVHALLVAYAKKHNYTLREAANRAILEGLATDLARQDARKKKRETEELLR